VTLVDLEAVIDFDFQQYKQFFNQLAAVAAAMLVIK